MLMLTLSGTGIYIYMLTMLTYADAPRHVRGHVSVFYTVGWSRGTCTKARRRKRNTIICRAYRKKIIQNKKPGIRAKQWSPNCNAPTSPSQARES
jgi:hypothetical protein